MTYYFYQNVKQKICIHLFEIKHQGQLLMQFYFLVHSVLITILQKTFFEIETSPTCGSSSDDVLFHHRALSTNKYTKPAFFTVKY